MADMTQHLAGQSEVVPTEDAAPVQQRFYGLDYAALIGGGTVDTIEGFDLITSEFKHVLIGVPFVVVGVTYRPGIAKGDIPANYVSVELVTADKATVDARVKAGRVTDKDGKVLTEAMVGANETLVINDGSTGIARQMTEYLHRRGLINVGAISSTADLGGEMGTSPWDRFFAEWPQGGTEAGVGFKLPPRVLHCPRGLRVSKYQNPVNQKDTSYTYYLA
jgi:hypothetical protein